MKICLKIGDMISFRQTLKLYLTAEGLKLHTLVDSNDGTIICPSLFVEKLGLMTNANDIDTYICTRKTYSSDLLHFVYILDSISKQ